MSKNPAVEAIKRILERKPDAGITRADVVDIMERNGEPASRIGQILTMCRVYRRDVTSNGGTKTMYYLRGTGPGKGCPPSQPRVQAESSESPQQLLHIRRDQPLTVTIVIEELGVNFTGQVRELDVKG